MSSLATGDIVGIAIGGVLAVVTVIGIVVSIYAMCCKKEPTPQQYPQQQNSGQYGNPYGQQMNTRYYGQQPYPPQQAWSNPQFSGDSPPSYNNVNYGGKH